MRNKSKQPISKIQDKIWQECRRIKRIGKDRIDCYTCPAKNLVGVNCQLGHMWAKASLPACLKYELDILEYQCFRCNINFGGMGADFRKRKEKELGKKRILELEKLRQKTVKAYDYYVDLLAHYETL